MTRGRLKTIVVTIVFGTPLLLGVDPATAARAKKCPKPPVTMRVEAAGATPAGDAQFRVTDGVARRVAILPNATADLTDSKARARLERKASNTPLALYSIHLADFDIPWRQLEAATFGDVSPRASGTVATLTVVPPAKRGFREGDVITGRDLSYDTTTTFAPLGLTVRSVDNASASLAYTDAVGEVTIIELGTKRICVDIDVELHDGDELVTAARGTVSVPVVRAPDSFFFT